ncbi:signal recognition particle receptor beta subunit-domain-containing protein [Protomyces lactucae-debilis]|uniref:Signal recognition particle receptor subunit beta n=1 Tax=Protomyces lactucae-debilis TaxID=2754530 RepID=A0A1Y2FLN7_PROLT|nr:signal recognition particle receptor beta subunit-domain-containing protein [Protomyces lactucae-debilis]ORY84849.1 signal recognition particle receptor beta subunit-domain-containing protein [Protomyces lactucae-debilis]
MGLYLLIFSSLLLAIILAAAFYYLQSQQGILTLPLTAQQSIVLITGPTAAGKTALLQRLAYGHATIKPTYTSQAINSARYVSAGQKTRQLVDVPGHPKLSGLMTTAQGLGKLSRVIFVLDASALSKQAPAVAQRFLDTLTMVRQKNLPFESVLVLANKSDFFTALDKQGVSKALEEAIAEIRRAMGGAVRMEAMEEERDEQALEWLAESDERFSLAGEGIEVLCGSVLKGQGMQTLSDWLD